MKLIGHGVDIVENHRIEATLREQDILFLNRCFTEKEQELARDEANYTQFIAGRFAAKEAILKTLGTGWSQDIAWTDIEIDRLPTGQPTPILSGQCKKIANEIGISSWLLSISHCPSYTIASAIGF